jgi:hypothetical protein
MLCLPTASPFAPRRLRHVPAALGKIYPDCQCFRKRVGRLWPVADATTPGRGFRLLGSCGRDTDLWLRLPFNQPGIRNDNINKCRWCPVLKQVLPWRSLSSAAEIDPVRTTQAEVRLAKSSSASHRFYEWENAQWRFANAILCSANPGRFTSIADDQILFFHNLTVAIEDCA